MQPSGFYESDSTLAQYSEFHFGDQWHGEANFPKALADAAINAMAGYSKVRALDIGCAVGRASFELATRFDHVDGIDFSASFISKAQEMARQQQIRYARPEEGELVSYHERTLAVLGLGGVAGKVAFHQGDACNLDPQFTNYDLILAGNLIDRLYQPSKFLTTIHERLNDGGFLVIASPYTWLEEYTPKDSWIGGFVKDGEDYSTRDGLTDILKPYFFPQGEPQRLPFVIRETRNKFQHSFSELTVWRKIRD